MKPLEAYDNATRLNPLDKRSWSEITDILLGQGKYEEALRACNISISIDLQYPSTSPYQPDSQVMVPLLKKSDALYCLGRYNEAVKVLDKAIELDSESNSPAFWVNSMAYAWSKKGAALEALGKFDEALQAYEKAGSTLKLLNRTTEADAAFAKAKKLGYTGLF
jgi:tetratricopeptide (TPR) repeat protein